MPSVRVLVWMCTHDQWSHGVGNEGEAAEPQQGGREEGEGLGLLGFAGVTLGLSLIHI